MGREVASLLPPTPAVRCRGSVGRPTQVSSVLFPVDIRLCHFQQCGRLSLSYRSGQTVCREPHQELGLTGIAFFEAEVTRQDTEHNIVSPIPQSSGSFGHILCPVLQQGVQEIHTTWEALVIKAKKTGRAVKTPNLALRASCTTITRDVPLKGTPLLHVRTEDNCPA